MGNSHPKPSPDKQGNSHPKPSPDKKGNHHPKSSPFEQPRKSERPPSPRHEREPAHIKGPVTVMKGQRDGRQFDGRKDMEHKFLAWKDSFKLVNTTGRPLHYAVAADPNALKLTKFAGGAHAGATKAGANVCMTWDFARASPLQKDTIGEAMNEEKNPNMPSGQAYVTVLARSTTGEFYYVLFEDKLVKKGDTFNVRQKRVICVTIEQSYNRGCTIA